MQSRRAKCRAPANADRTAAEAAAERQCAILVVGELGRWRGADLAVESGFRCVEFHEVGPELLARLRPAMVLSPLVCGAFDCLDLAHQLRAAGFSGRYRAMCAGLPDPTLIRREIAESCPDLDFDIVELSRERGTWLN